MADSSVVENMFVQENVLDSGIRKYELSRYTTNQPFNASSNPPEILIDTLSGSLDSFPLLDRSFVDVIFKFVSAGSTNFTTVSKAQIIANGWLLFSRATLSINDMEVENVERPGLCSHVKHLIEDTRDSIIGNASAGSYYPCDYDVPAALVDTDGIANADLIVNKAVKRYRQAATLDHHVRLYLRDVFGFAAVAKCIPGARIKIRLWPETSFERVIMQSTNSDADIARLTGCDLYLANCRPDNELLREVYSKFTSGETVPLEFESMQYQELTIASAAVSANDVIANSFKRPTAVNILLQLADQTSDFTKDKLAGKTFDITNHRLQVDSKQYPESGYEGKNKGYLHEYETFLQLGNKHHNSVYGSFVDYDKWKNVYPVLSYDLRTIRDEMPGARTHPPNIQWKASFTAPGAAAFAHVIISGKEVRNLNMINGVLTVTAPSFTD